MFSYLLDAVGDIILACRKSDRRLHKCIQVTVKINQNRSKPAWHGDLLLCHPVTYYWRLEGGNILSDLMLHFMEAFPILHMDKLIGVFLWPAVLLWWISWRVKPWSPVLSIWRKFSYLDSFPMSNNLSKAGISQFFLIFCFSISSPHISKFRTRDKFERHLEK